MLVVAVVLHVLVAAIAIVLAVLVIASVLVALVAAITIVLGVLVVLQRARRVCHGVLVDAIVLVVLVGAIELVAVLAVLFDAIVLVVVLVDAIAVISLGITKLFIKIVNGLLDVGIRTATGSLSPRLLSTPLAYGLDVFLLVWVEAVPHLLVDPMAPDLFGVGVDTWKAIEQFTPPMQAIVGVNIKHHQKPNAVGIQHQTRMG